MRKLLGVAALAASVMGFSSATAQELTPPQEWAPYQWVVTERGSVTTKVYPPNRGWYVGGEFGAMIVEDTDVDIGTVDNAMRLNYDYGYDGGLFVGYDLGAFRIEAEAAYKKADLDSFNTIIRLPGEGATFPASRPFAGGSASALSFMINGMLDFGAEEEVGDISGFVGGGVGMARVKANNNRVFANTAPFLDDSDSKLAWQVFAGVRQRITNNLDVTVKYRFFNVDNVRMVAFNGADSELRFRSHSLLGGLTYRFGGRTERIEVPEKRQCVSGGPPNSPEVDCPDRKRCTPSGPEVDLSAPCPPPPIETWTGGPFMVFFDWDQDKITLAGEGILNGVVDTYNKTGQAHVMITGHADRSGPVGYNQGLSQRRADAVRTYLREHGIPESVMTTEAFGESKPLVDTEDGVREPQNRRVEITGGPGAGW